MAFAFVCVVQARNELIPWSRLRAKCTSNKGGEGEEKPWETLLRSVASLDGRSARCFPTTA